MFSVLKHDAFKQHRYALCVGIDRYNNLNNDDLRYAISDAVAIANRLQDQQRGRFEVECLIEAAKTTKLKLEEAIDVILNGKHLNPHDLVVIYLSCHGKVY